MRYAARVYELVRCVTTLPDRTAGVVDLVAGCETLHCLADGLDDPRSVVAHDLIPVLKGRGPWSGHVVVVVWVVVVDFAADFCVDWVYGAGFDAGDLYQSLVDARGLSWTHDMSTS